MGVIFPLPASEDIARILNSEDRKKTWSARPLLEEDRFLNLSSLTLQGREIKVRGHREGDGNQG